MNKRVGTSLWTSGWPLLLVPLAIFMPSSHAQTPQFQIPPPPQSQRASANRTGPGMIDVRQPSFPAQIVVSQHVGDDWLSYAQINNHGTQNIVSIKLGWAYVLPTGLEYHSGETVPVPGGFAPPRGNFYLEQQQAAPRPTAKDFLDFVEQVTLADGTVIDADHAQIAAFYNQCCTAGAAKNALALEPSKDRSTPPTALPSVAIRLSPKINAQGLGVIPVPQPDLPTEIVAAQQSPDDLLVSVRLHNRSMWGFHTYRMGWAYVLPTGLEYHTGDLVTLDRNMGTDGTTDVPDQHVSPRADAKEFLFFVEEETQGDGTLWKSSHEKIEAQYRLCCSQRKAGEYVAKAAPAGSPSWDDPLTADSPIKFDVVSLRPAQEPGRGREMPGDADFIAYHGSTMNALLQFAYQHNGYFVISGQPEWVDRDFWEFQAKVAPEDIAIWKKLTLTQKRMMVRAVLVEQLKLKIHTDMVEHPVYNLVVAKGGPKLTEYRPGDTLQPPGGNGGQVLTGKVLRWFDPFNLVCQDETMGDLANSISGANRAGRVVYDKTELTGAYNFTVPIPYAPLPAQLQQLSEDSGVPTVFEGMKKLGLQLISAKGLIDGIVVDHIDKPAGN